MGLSIIIVNFNTINFLRKCLESIKKLETIVIDNGSTDGSVETIKKFQIPNSKFQIKLIENKQNLGFARAVNQGIKQATGEYIFLLNPDTEVKPGALEELVKFASKHPEAGVVGAKLLNPDGSIQPSVYHFPTIWRAIKEYWLGKKGAYEKYTVTGTDPVRVEAVTGAAMLIPRATIKKIGILDERYFMYFEDLDFCRRARKAGLKVYYLPQAEVVHQHGASGKGEEVVYQYLMESSKIYNGILKYWLLTVVLWIGQKWQKLLRI